MKLAVIGVNHKSCPIEIREKVAFTRSKEIEGMRLLAERSVTEVVILSTCNRSEIYIYDHDLEAAINKVKNFYSEFFDQPHIKEYLFVKTGKEAIAYLYRVASGLDSIVIGEDQILGQVKAAHTLAMTYHTSGKVLNKVFREAITSAKEIKNKTKISEQPLSISRIAVKFLKEKQGTLKDKTALIIGAGKMNELTIKYLLEEEVGIIYVMNRTHTKAISLTDKYEGLVPIHYDERYEVLEEVDFVISATASPHIILEYEKMKELKKALYIMDIAMPRDIDPRINRLPFAYVYDIDDLKAISTANNIKRQELAQEAEHIIARNIEELIKWLELLDVEPVILRLNEKCSRIEKNALETIYKKINIAEEDKKALEKIVALALKKVVKAPIAKLKETEDLEQREVYINAVEELFGLKVKEEEGARYENSSRY